MSGIGCGIVKRHKWGAWAGMKCHEIALNNERQLKLGSNSHQTEAQPSPDPPGRRQPEREGRPWRATPAPKGLEEAFGGTVALRLDAAARGRLQRPQRAGPGAPRCRSWGLRPFHHRPFPPHRSVTLLCGGRWFHENRIPSTPNSPHTSQTPAHTLPQRPTRGYCTAGLKIADLVDGLELTSRVSKVPTQPSRPAAVCSSVWVGDVGIRRA